MPSLEEATTDPATVLNTSIICTAIASLFIILRLGMCLTTLFFRHRGQAHGGIPHVFNRRSFRADDIVMLLSIAPLMVRLPTSHLYLAKGTTNSSWVAKVQLAGHEENVVLGSKLVLVGRWAYVTL